MESNTRIATTTNKPWGALATLAFGVLIMLITNASAYLLFFGLYKFADFIPMDLPPAQDMTQYNGFILALSTLFITPVTLLLLVLFIKLRKGISVTEYIGLYTFDTTKQFKWCGLLLLFLVFTEFISQIIDRPFVPEFMDEAFHSAENLYLLFAALVIGAPITEEFLFRGFLITGFSRSRLGWHGAIIFTAILWAAIHVQYDWYDISWIVFLGLVLGYAKKDTGSIYVPLIMHALVNTLSFIATMLYFSA